MEEQTFQKEIEFYSAAVTGWLHTRLEHDKSLLTLSAGGIGLLMTLLTTVGVTSKQELAFYLLAMFSFLICLGSVLAIFKNNSSHIEDAIRGGAIHSTLLGKLDNIAITAFMLGVAFTFIIGILAACNSYLVTKENNMANVSKKSAEITANRVFVGDSVNGLANLKPSGSMERSFNGMSNLKPSSQSQSSATTTTKPLTSSSTVGKK